jgi:hypothetical protein
VQGDELGQIHWGEQLPLSREFTQDERRQKLTAFPLGAVFFQRRIFREITRHPGF